MQSSLYPYVRVVDHGPENKQWKIISRHKILDCAFKASYRNCCERIIKVSIDRLGLELNTGEVIDKIQLEHCIHFLDDGKPL